MKQEYKELLLKDLCARLPYGVKIHKVLYGATTLNERDIDSFRKGIEDILIPYLRPRSSMTEEEKKKLGRISCEGNIEHKYGIFYRSQDYLNSIHVAYRTIDGKDMFELGLALEAPEGMYK